MSQTVSSQWCSLMKQECYDDIFALASTRAGDGVKIKVALVGDGGPVDRINGVNNFVFVVENGYIVVEDFLDLGEEVRMDESHFLGCIGIFRYKLETDRDLGRFVSSKDGSGASFRGCGRNVVIGDGRRRAISLAS